MGFYGQRNSDKTGVLLQLSGTFLQTSHYRTITWREGEGQSLKIVSAKLSSPTEIKPMSRYDLVKFPKVYSADRLIYSPQQRLFYILQVHTETIITSLFNRIINSNTFPKDSYYY